MSARGTKSTSDLESKVEVSEHDIACPMPINAVWRPMPPSHATAAARLPYVSAISRGTTKVRLGDRHPRDGPRDKPTELSIEDPRESINPQEVLNPTDLTVFTKGKIMRVRLKRIIPGTPTGRTNVRPTKMSLIILVLEGGGPRAVHLDLSVLLNLCGGINDKAIFSTTLVEK
ncbi:hypothetical protein GW17_00039728 [Ensete ventricosum]|nr:hypothetical protein GW17_00039728 [Ensete ventricosum]